MFKPWLFGAVLNIQYLCSISGGLNICCGLTPPRQNTAPEFLAEVGNAPSFTRKTSILGKMTQAAPRFWHVPSQHNHVIVETYCLLCFKFVGASKLAFNLTLVEFAHRLVCKPAESGGSLPGSLPPDSPSGPLL
jgi:hypothetical protein